MRESDLVHFQKRIGDLTRELAEARAALEVGLDAFGAFMKEANWGASALSADTIRKANDTPGQMQRALASRNPADGRLLLGGRFML